MHAYAVFLYMSSTVISVQLHMFAITMVNEASRRHDFPPWVVGTIFPNGGSRQMKEVKYHTLNIAKFFTVLGPLLSSVATLPRVAYGPSSSKMLLYIV